MVKKEKQRGVLGNCSAFADEDPVCEAIRSYSSRRNYAVIMDQIVGRIMQSATSEAWGSYTSEEKNEIIDLTAQEIRRIRK